MKSGWIKLHRSLLEWEWYDDVNVKILFLHCALKANHTSKNWRGVTIGRGQFYTSLETLSKETGLSIQQARTAISKLESTGEITSKKHAKARMITVVNYASYQADNKQSNKQSTSNQQAKQQESNKKVTTTKNEKNEKKKKNKQKEIVLSFDSQKFKNAWDEWLVYLKQKRKTPTLLTQNKQMKFLESQGEDKAIASINRSITNGWQGLFAEKDEAETQTMADKIRAQNMKKLC